MHLPVPYQINFLWKMIFLTQNRDFMEIPQISPGQRLVAKLWDSICFISWKSMNYEGKPLLIIFLGVYSNLSDPRRGFELITGLSRQGGSPLGNKFGCLIVVS